MISIFIMVLVFLILLTIIFAGFGSARGDMAVCFNDLNDYFEFRLKNDDKTDYTVVYPCPENPNLLNQTIPKDESNK